MIKEYGIAIIQFVYYGDINLCKNYMGILNNKKRNEAVQEFITLEKALAQTMETTPNLLTLTKHGIDLPTYKRYFRKYVNGADVPHTDTLSKQEFEVIRQDYDSSSLTIPVELNKDGLTDVQLLYISRIINHIKQNYNILGFAKLKKYVSGESYTIFGGRLTSIYSILHRYKTIDKSNIALLSVEKVKIDEVLSNKKSSTLLTKNLNSGIRTIIESLGDGEKFKSKLANSNSLPSLTKAELCDVLLRLAEVGFVGLDTLIGVFTPPKTKAELIENISPRDKTGIEMLRGDVSSKIYFGGSK